MRFHALHGVLPVEGIIGNDYLVSLEMDADVEEAEQSDDLNGTINYAEVYDLVKKEMDMPSKLIEHVAYRIQQRVTTQFPKIKSMTTEVAKLRPPVGGVVDSASVKLNFVRK